MNPKTELWIEKAEGDWETMTRESRVVINPNYDAVCFHAQQCAEKYIKARLFDASVPFAKTHDLVHLLNELLKIEPQWEYFRNYAIVLTSFAVEFRYPGTKAEESDASEAVEHCNSIRNDFRNAFRIN